MTQENAFEETETDDTADGGDENAFDGDDVGGDSPAPVGIKLGSTRTIITLPNGDGTDSVRALTCIATYDDPLTGEERVLYGEQAATEYADRVQFMLRSGLPEDEENAELAKTFLGEIISANSIPGDSVVVYAIPTIENQTGLDNLDDIVKSSAVGEQLVRSYPESLCGAIPAYGDGLSAIESTFIAVNMGSTNLEASAYRRGEQLAPFATGSVTGNGIDQKIANYVEDETQGRVNIDLTTAREYKETHGDFDSFEPFTDIIQQPGGGTHEFTIERSVMDALDEYIDDAVEEVANTFLPQLANDHMKVYQTALDKPIALTGGMACIPGILDVFEERLSEEIDREVEVITADEPATAAAKGAQRIANRLTELRAY